MLPIISRSLGEQTPQQSVGKEPYIQSRAVCLDVHGTEQNRRSDLKKILVASAVDIKIFTDTNIYR